MDPTSCRFQGGMGRLVAIHWNLGVVHSLTARDSVDNFLIFKSMVKMMSHSITVDPSYCRHGEHQEEKRLSYPGTVGKATPRRCCFQV